jgi:hypothetical protein
LVQAGVAGRMDTVLRDHRSQEERFMHLDLHDCDRQG